MNKQSYVWLRQKRNMETGYKFQNLLKSNLNLSFTFSQKYFILKGILKPNFELGFRDLRPLRWKIFEIIFPLNCLMTSSWESPK